MVAATFTKEERVGLGIAILAHIALLAMLLFRPAPGDIVKPPERIEVTLSDEVGLTSTSPEPMAAAAPDVAPEIGERAPAEPDLSEHTPVEPAPVARPDRPRPAPVAAARPLPRPVVRPISRPRRIDRPARRPPSKSGGSRVGNDFLEGTPGARDSGRSTSPSAAAIGPRVRSALSGAIRRQLKPHWSAPQGADAELLVTTVRFKLARDGSLVGEPEALDTRGQNDANATQVARHREQAIRAVKLAAPFNLPTEYYSDWRQITTNFDKRL